MKGVNGEIIENRIKIEELRKEMDENEKKRRQSGFGTMFVKFSKDMGDETDSTAKKYLWWAYLTTSLCKLAINALVVWKISNTISKYI
jgi:hypothetical protein